MHASTTSFVGTAEAVKPIRRIQIAPMSLWTLFVIQAILVLILGFAIARVLPKSAPLAATPDYSLVRDAVLQRATGAMVDPLVEYQSGMMAPASSLRGFALNGAIYYYQILGQSNYDPLSRHLVSSEDINIVLRDTNGPNTLLIYTLTK